MKYKLIAFLAVFALLATGVQASHMDTCAISTGHGLLNDYDCDGIPDMKDDCPKVHDEKLQGRECPKTGYHDPYERILTVEHKNSYQHDYKNTQTQARTSETSTVRETRRTAGEDTKLTKSTIKITKTQEIFLDGPGAVYPIQVKNENDKARTFEFSVSNVNFGTFSIDPASKVTLKPGEEKTLYLHLTAEGVEEGQYPFTMTVQSGDRVKSVQLTANVLEERTSEDRNIGKKALWIIAILVIIAAIVLLIREFEGRGGNTSREEEDIYSYY